MFSYIVPSCFLISVDPDGYRFGRAAIKNNINESWMYKIIPKRNIKRNKNPNEPKFWERIKIMGKNHKY